MDIPIINANNATTNEIVTLNLCGKVVTYDKESLCWLSDYFKSLLARNYKENQKDGTIVLSDLTENMFKQMVLWHIYEKPLGTLDEILQLFIALDKYQVRGFDKLKFLKKLNNYPGQLVKIIEAVGQLYDDIPDEVMNILASFYRSTDDFTTLDDEFKDCLLSSPYCRKYGERLVTELIVHLESLAVQEQKTNVLKKYVITHECGALIGPIGPIGVIGTFDAYGLADLILQLHDYLQYDDTTSTNYKTYVANSLVNTLEVKPQLATVIFKDMPANTTISDDVLYINGQRQGKLNIIGPAQMLAGGIIVTQCAMAIVALGKFDVATNTFTIDKLNSAIRIISETDQTANRIVRPGSWDDIIPVDAQQDSTRCDTRCVTTRCNPCCSSNESDSEDDCSDSSDSFDSRRDDGSIANFIDEFIANMSCIKEDVTVKELFELTSNVDEVLLNILSGFIVREQVRSVKPY